MSEQATVTVDPELARLALGEVLDADAAAQPAAAPPPRREPPPDATPEAPWGFKADGTPRKGPPGPGRPRKDKADEARTTEQQPPGTPAPEAAKLQPAADYSDDIGGVLTMVWMGMASIPWTRAHAAIVRIQTPTMVPAWNAAAQQNATIRRYVLKWSGEGSWAWVLPVTITTVPLILGMWQVARDPELRAQLAARTEQDFAAFIAEHAAAAGITVPGAGDGEAADTSARADLGQQGQAA